MTHHVAKGSTSLSLQMRHLLYGGCRSACRSPLCVVGSRRLIHVTLHVICMQVDLTTSSIRPGQPVGWQSALQDTLQGAVARSTARITVFTGTWQHDVDQAQLLEHHPDVQIKVSSGCYAARAPCLPSLPPVPALFNQHGCCGRVQRLQFSTHVAHHHARRQCHWASCLPPDQPQCCLMSAMAQSYSL